MTALSEIAALTPREGPASVVPLEFRDIANVAAIETAVFPEPLSPDQVARLWARPGVRYVGVRDGDRLLAYFGFEVEGPTAHVIANATHPAGRRRGLGEAVLRAGEPVARALGGRWFLGEVRRSNAVQLRLLDRLGWRVVGISPAFFGNGEDAYVVWRGLV